MISLSKGHILLIINDRDWLEKVYHSFSFHKHIRYVDIDGPSPDVRSSRELEIRCVLYLFANRSTQVFSPAVDKHSRPLWQPLSTPLRNQPEGTQPQAWPREPWNTKEGGSFQALFIQDPFTVTEWKWIFLLFSLYTHKEYKKQTYFMKEHRKPEFQADLCDPDSVLWSDDLPHIRQHNQTSDEDNDAENRAGGQHKGLFQGHEPSS